MRGVRETISYPNHFAPSPAPSLQCTAEELKAIASAAALDDSTAAVVSHHSQRVIAARSDDMIDVCMISTNIYHIKSNQIIDIP